MGVSQAARGAASSGNSRQSCPEDVLEAKVKELERDLQDPSETDTLRQSKSATVEILEENASPTCVVGSKRRKKSKVI